MSTILLIVAGILIGTFVIALGGGGAAIYLGILSSAFHLPPAEAAATSIITALPSLLIGTFIYIKQKKVNFHYGNQMLIAALPAVIVGSLLAPHIPQLFYKWLIAIILILLGGQILYKQRKSSANKTVSSNKYAAVLYGIISGLMVGIAGLSGGGPVLAGLLILGLDTFDATATSSYVLSGMSLLGACFHLSSGDVYWQAGIPLIIGAIVGAIIAPIFVNHLAKNKHTAWTQYLIAILLIVMGIKSII